MWEGAAGGGQVDLACLPNLCARCERGYFAPEDGRHEVTSPDLAAEVLVPQLAGRDREACVMLTLDTKHYVLDVVLVSVGSIDHTFMAPREVYRDALLGNASAIVLGHNHPSGSVDPSADDRKITERLVKAGELIGIEVLDHLIVGGNGRWLSMARMGCV